MPARTNRCLIDCNDVNPRHVADCCLTEENVEALLQARKRSRGKEGELDSVTLKGCMWLTGRFCERKRKEVSLVQRRRLKIYWTVGTIALNLCHDKHPECHLSIRRWYYRRAAGYEQHEHDMIRAGMCIGNMVTYNEQWFTGHSVAALNSRAIGVHYPQRSPGVQDWGRPVNAVSSSFRHQWSASIRLG